MALRVISSKHFRYHPKTDLPFFSLGVVMFPKLSRFRLVVLFTLVLAAFVFSAIRFGRVTEAGGSGSMFFVPTITATDQDAIVTDADVDGRADPGDVVQYTVTVTNNGTDATGV